MAAIPGFRLDLTGASGSQGLLSPRDGWRAYVFPRGANASQDSTGMLITFDSAAIASRFAVNNWTQVGTNTANIVRVTAVGGNSMSVNIAVTVSTNDRVFLIGNTQPSVTGGSATYITPNTLVRQRGDDAATLYANSMITTNANGLVQGYALPAMYDVLVQDGNRSNQGYVADMEVGTVEGVSVTDTAIFSGLVTGNTINAVSIRSKSRPTYDVTHPDWGATGDGTTDDSTAINAAITAANAAGGGTVILPRGNYLILSPITLKANVQLVGVGGVGNDPGLGSYISVTTAINAINFDPLADNIIVRSIVVGGGVRAISRVAGTGPRARFGIYNCSFFSQTESNIYFEGDMEQVVIDDCRFGGAQYGLQKANVSEGGSTAFTKFTISNCVFSGTINGILLSGFSGAGTFINNFFSAIGQSAIAIASSGAGSHHVFINQVVESICTSVVNARWTTGSITAGTPTLVVVDSTGYSIGEVITIAGAGVNGIDYHPTINNIVGTTITINSNVPTTVTDAAVTRSIYDIVSLDGGLDHVFIACNFMDSNSLARYIMSTANLAQASITLINCDGTAAAPPSGRTVVYDPSGFASIIGGRITVRRPSNPAGDDWRVSTFACSDVAFAAQEPEPRTLLLSPKGKDFTVGLRDSDDAGTGTYGQFEIRKRDATRSTVHTVDANGSVTFEGSTTNNVVQAASLTLPGGYFFGVSGTLGAGTSIGSMTGTTGRPIVLWAAAGTMGFSNSNTLRVIGNSFNVPVNGAVQAFCTGTTWFVFSPSS